MTDLTLREKLRQIRDSDHPASNWARNVVQCLDDLKDRPDDPDLLRTLGKCVVMFERTLGENSHRFPRGKTMLTPDEITDIFRLRARMIRDPQ